MLPLQYDKNYTFSTNFSGNHQFALIEKSYLIIGKDKVGNYYTEIHTYYPDEKLANYPSKVFSGFATTQNWDNTIRDIYKYENGKMYKLLTSQGSVANSVEAGVNISASRNCYYINYFSCPPDYTDLSQCEYLGSELIGCGDEGTIQCEGNCGGITPPAADNIFQVVPRSYVIGGMYGYCYAEATFILKGYKFSFSQALNYFTELPTGSTQLVITNPGVPNPIYTHQYAISSWLSLTLGNKAVDTKARGSVNTNLFGTQVVENSKPYAAANEF